MYSFAFDEEMRRKNSLEDYNSEIRKLMNEFDELGLDLDVIKRSFIEYKKAYKYLQ